MNLKLLKKLVCLVTKETKKCQWRAYAWVDERHDVWRKSLVYQYHNLFFVQSRLIKLCKRVTLYVKTMHHLISQQVVICCWFYTSVWSHPGIRVLMGYGNYTRHVHISVLIRSAKTVFVDMICTMQTIQAPQ